MSFVKIQKSIAPTQYRLVAMDKSSDTGWVSTRRSVKFDHYLYLQFEMPEETVGIEPISLQFAYYNSAAQTTILTVDYYLYDPFNLPDNGATIVSGLSRGVYKSITVNIPSKGGLPTYIVPAQDDNAEPVATTNGGSGRYFYCRLSFTKTDTFTRETTFQDYRLNGYGLYDESFRVAINAENFPEAEIRAMLQTFDLDNDGYLTNEERIAITELPPPAFANKNINVYSFKGFDYLTELKKLDLTRWNCPKEFFDWSYVPHLEQLVLGTRHDLTSFDASVLPKLKSLDCCGCPLTALTVSQNPDLEELYINGRDLTAIDLTHNTKLKTLVSHYTSITAYDLSQNSLLETIDIFPYGYTNSSYPKISTITLGTYPNLQKFTCCGSIASVPLNLQNCTSLTDVLCDTTAFTTIDVSGCSNLENLVVRTTPVRSINVSGCTKIQMIATSISSTLTDVFAVELYECHDLVSLTCNNCTALQTLTFINLYDNDRNLASLSVAGCTALKQLRVSSNKLVSLDLRACDLIEKVECEGNRLTSLQFGNAPNLRKLICYGNNLQGLSLENAPHIETLIQNEDYCFDRDTLHGADVYHLSYPDRPYIAEALMDWLAGLGAKVLSDPGHSEETDSFSVDYGLRVSLSNGPFDLLNDPPYDSIPLDAEHFPDAGLRYFLSERYDRNNDGILDSREVGVAENINPSSSSNISIASLSGIQYLPRLRYIDLRSGHPLTSIDLSQNPKVSTVYITDTSLSSINLTGCEKLSVLFMPRNQLTSLNLSGLSELKYCLCHDNLLTDVTFGNNTNLIYAIVSGNNLASFDVSTLSKLAYLNCAQNQFNSLDVSHNSVLMSLFSSSDDPQMESSRTESSGLVDYELRRANDQNASDLVAFLRVDDGVKLLGVDANVDSDPSDLYIKETQTGSFQVEASGLDISYQWQYLNAGQWEDITGGNAATFSVTASSSNDGAQYRCKIFNSVNTVYSNAVTLHVVPLLNIITQPASQTIAEDTDTSFSVRVVGLAPAYQWQVSTDNGENWEDIANETASSYTFIADKVQSGNQYRCIVTNEDGTLVSDPAVLTVTAALITVSPKVPNNVYQDPLESITFVWSTLADPDDIMAYELQYKAGDGVWATLITIQNPGALSQHSVQGGFFQESHQIQWRIRAYNTDNIAGSWSALSFYTAIGLVTATPSRPKSGIYVDRSTSVTFMWSFTTATNGVPSGSELQIATENTESAYTALDTVAGEDRSYTVRPDTLPSGTIYWRVRAYNQNNVAGPWGYASFTTKASSGSGGSGSGSGSVPSGNITVTPGEVPDDPSDIYTGIKTCTFSEGYFSPGRIYWRVRCYGSDGSEGEWSDTVSFMCYGVTQVKDLYCDGKPFATVLWDASGQVSYEIRIDDKIQYGPYHGVAGQFTLPEPLEDGPHIIAVQIQNDLGLQSPWSSVSINVKNVPSYTGNLTLQVSGSLDANLDWGSVPAAAAAQPRDEFLVYRDGRLIKVFDSSITNHVDRLVLGWHQYDVIQHLPTGYYNRYTHPAVYLHTDITKIALYEGGPWFDLKLTTDRYPTNTFKKTRVTEKTRIMGARYPVVEVSGFEELSAQYEAYWPYEQRNLAYNFQSMFGQVVVLKSRGEQVICGVLDGYELPVNSKTIGYSFTIEQIETETDMSTQLVYDLTNLDEIAFGQMDPPRLDAVSTNPGITNPQYYEEIAEAINELKQYIQFLETNT